MIRTINKAVFVLALGAFLAVGGVNYAAAQPAGIMEKTSNSDFDRTIQQLKTAVSANQLVLLQEFNHQQMVQMAGGRADSSIVLEVFHPRFGRVINDIDRAAFIVAPLRIMVQQQGNDVVVSYQLASVYFEPYDNDLEDLGGQLDTLIANIVDAGTM